MLSEGETSRRNKYIQTENRNKGGRELSGFICKSSGQDKAVSEIREQELQ